MCLCVLVQSCHVCTDVASLRSLHVALYPWILRQFLQFLYNFLQKDLNHFLSSVSSVARDEVTVRGVRATEGQFE